MSASSLGRAMDVGSTKADHSVGRQESGSRGEGDLRVTAIEGLAAFVERRGDRAAEVVWQASLAMLERAFEDARGGAPARWRWYPRGELRRLRRDVAQALELARLAVALQEEDAEQSRELDLELARAAAEVGKVRRRAQTLPAERARLAKSCEKKFDVESRDAGGAGGV